MKTDGFTLVAFIQAGAINKGKAFEKLLMEKAAITHEVCSGAFSICFDSTDLLESTQHEQKANNSYMITLDNSQLRGI